MQNVGVAYLLVSQRMLSYQIVFLYIYIYIYIKFTHNEKFNLVEIIRKDINMKTIN